MSTKTKTAPKAKTTTSTSKAKHGKTRDKVTIAPEEIARIQAFQKAKAEMEVKTKTPAFLESCGIRPWLANTRKDVALEEKVKEGILDGKLLQDRQKRRNRFDRLKREEITFNIPAHLAFDVEKEIAQILQRERDSHGLEGGDRFRADAMINSPEDYAKIVQNMEIVQVFMRDTLGIPAGKKATA